MLKINLNKEELKSLKELMKKELESNPYNREIRNLQKKITAGGLNKRPFIDNVIPVIDEDMKRIRDITNVFIETGVLTNKRDEAPTREEIKNIKLILEAASKLEGMKKDFYTLTKEKYTNYDTYKKRLDVFCNSIGNAYLELYHNVKL